MVEDDLEEWLGFKKMLRKGTFLKEVAEDPEDTTSAALEEKLLQLLKHNRTQAAISLLGSNTLQGNAVDTDGSRALHHTARIGNIELLKLMLDLGSKPSACDKNGQIPLHWAAISGNTDCFVYLLGREGHIVADSMGRNSLHFAASTGNLDVTEAFLSTRSFLEH